MPFPVLAAIAAAGAIGKYFSDRSAAHEQQNRYNTSLYNLDTQKKKTLAEGTRLINLKTKGQISRSRASTARRMQALGFSSEANSFILPSEQVLAEQGNQSLRDFLFSTNQFYDQQKANLDMGYAGRPIQAGLGDYISELAPAAISYAENQDFLNAYKEANTVKEGVNPENLGVGTGSIDLGNIVSPTAESGIVAPTSGPTTPDWASSMSKSLFSPTDLTGFSRLSNLSKPPSPPNSGMKGITLTTRPKKRASDFFGRNPQFVRPTTL